jgi:hypothetical protein
MSNEPLDLRALAEVDEPDVVRDALRTFRRRVLTRYVWATVAIVLVGGAFLWAVRPHTLAERVATASPRFAPQMIWRVGSTSVGLADVVRLRDGVGMRFVVIEPNDEARNCLAMPAGIASEFPVDGFDAYFEVPRTDAGIYEVQVTCGTGAPRTLTVDLAQLHIQQDL